MSETRKVVINACHGGFGISDAAYEKLIEWGIPARKYIEQGQDPETGLYLPQPANEGEVIFDRELTPRGESRLNDIYHAYKGKASTQQRYWETWVDKDRSDARLIRLVEEMGDAVHGPCARLKIVEIPADVDYEIDEYDGYEHVAEKHRTWG